MPDSTPEEAGRRLITLASALYSQKLMNRAGLAGVRRIQSRTRRGVDFEGRPFVSAPTAEAGSPYSPGHRSRREAKGLPVDKVNLQMTLYGGSMQTFTHTVAADFSSVALGFESARAERIMRFHNVDGAGRSRVIRQNIRLSGKDITDIEALVEDHVRDLITTYGFE